MSKRLMMFLLLVLASPVLYAQSICKADLELWPEPALFGDIYNQALETGSLIANPAVIGVSRADMDARFLEFARFVREQASARLAHLPLDLLPAQLDAFVALAEQGVDLNLLPDYALDPDPLMPGAFLYRFTHNSDTLTGVVNVNDAACAGVDQDRPGCRIALQALAAAINPYKAAYVHCSAQATALGAERLNAQWERYFDEARSQTFADIWLTTLMERKHLRRNHLVGPMKRQWILLHPGLVIENVDAARDGESLREALALEWIGVNWWDAEASPLNFPFGISIASVYSDRAEIDDHGIGLMFHFGNSYSIGWANHDGEDGFYLTVDLLKLFDDRKAQWQAYKADLEAAARLLD